MVYYNEIDPYAAQWLRNLIAAGHIAPGDVDERSIVDVRADDLRGYRQCHFFAGIGVWSYALRLAGWPDDREVWTGSCPCQPFSAAGKREGYADERHLWPHWHRLIRERRPATVFGEQVSAAIGSGWLDDVCLSLEELGYALGAASFPACSVGAPHIRQRVYFVADSAGNGWSEGWTEPARQQRQSDTAKRISAGELANADGGHASAEGLQRGGQHGFEPQDGSAGELADADGTRRGAGRAGQAGDGRSAARLEFAGLCAAGDLGDSDDARSQGRSLPGAVAGGDGGNQCAAGAAGAVNGFWSDADWLPCLDGKARAVEPGTFPLAHGAPARVGRLRAYGNAIVAEAAAEFIRACLEVKPA